MARQVSEPTEALGEVIRRNPRNLRTTLERIAASPARPSELRRIASVTLGQLQDKRSVPALLAAAKSADDALSRRAVEALGRVGAAETLAPLGRLRKGAPRVRKSLAFAQSMIAYRHGVKGWSLKLPRRASVAQVDSDRAVVLSGKPQSLRKWGELRSSLRVIKEVLPPADTAPLTFRCGNDELLLLVNPSLAGDWQSAMTRPLVAAALLKFSLARQRWFVVEYVFCDPLRAGRARLTGARPTGTVVHTGAAIAEHGNVYFTLQSLDTPLAMPMTVTATVGSTVPRGFDFAVLVERTRSRNVNKPRTPAQLRVALSPVRGHRNS